MPPHPGKWSSTPFEEFRTILTDELGYQTMADFTREFGISRFAVDGWRKRGVVATLAMACVQKVREARHWRAEAERATRRLPEAITVYFQYNKRRKITIKELAEVFGVDEPRIERICDELAEKGLLE